MPHSTGQLIGIAGNGADLLGVVASGDEPTAVGGVVALGVEVPAVGGVVALGVESPAV